MLRILIIVFIFVLTACASRTIKDEKRAHLHLSIGTDHLNNGRYPQALSELTTAVNYDPYNPIIHNNLGIAYYVRKKFSEAEKHLRKAVELKSNYTEARNNLSRVLIDMSLFDEAIRLLKISNRDLQYAQPEKTKSSLGIAYFKKNKFKSAKKYLGQSLKLRGQHCQTSNYFARSLFELKKYDQAAIAFDQAVNNCKMQVFDEPVYYGGLTYFK